MKIQLDHKIIRDLLDKDQEFCLEVKRAVLDSAIKHETWKAIDQDIGKAVSEQLRLLNNGQYHFEKGKYVLSSQLKELIAVHYRHMLDEALVQGFSRVVIDLNAAIEKKVSDLSIYIDQQLAKSLTEGTAAYIDKAVKDRLDKIMEALKKEEG